MAKLPNKTAFQALPETLQHLLELVSIIYSTERATPIIQSAIAAGITLESGAKPTPQAIKSKLRSLSEEGWLIHSGSTLSPLYRCPEHTRDELTRQAVQAGRLAGYATAIHQYFDEAIPANYHDWSSSEEVLRYIRLNMLQGNDRKSFELMSIYQHIFRTEHPWLLIWGKPFDLRWIDYLPEQLLVNSILPPYLKGAYFELDEVDAIWAKIAAHLTDKPQYSIWDQYGGYVYWQPFARGQWDDPLLAEPKSGSVQSARWHSMQAIKHLYNADQPMAIKVHKKGLAALRKLFKAPSGQKVWYWDPFEILYVLTLILSDDAKKIIQGVDQARIQQSYDLSYRILYDYGQTLKTGRKESLELKPEELDSPLALLLMLCTTYWLGETASAALLALTEKKLTKAEAAGYEWLVGEYAAALAILLPQKAARQKVYEKRATTLQKKMGLPFYLIHLSQPQQAWERSLGVLMRIGSSKSNHAANASNQQSGERLVWKVQKKTSSFGNRTHYDIMPSLQKSNKSGWTSGRNVAMKHLHGAPTDLAYLDEDDLRVCRTIELDHESHYSRYGVETYIINPERVWSALIGHPRVFWVDAPKTPLDIQQGKEELLTERVGKKIRIKLHPALKDDTDYAINSDLVIEETTIQLRVYHLTPAVLQLHEVLGEAGLVVPPEAETTLRKALESLAPMITIQSDIQVGDDSSAETVKADSRLHIYLLPWGDGLRMMMRVQPFADQGGPVFPPGSGRSNLMAEVKGQLLKTTRHLKKELAEALKISQHCAALEEWIEPEEDLMLEEPERCLEALEQLHALGDTVSLAWPEGEKMRITAPVTASGLSLKIASKGEWFNLDGQVTVDADTVLSLRQLLALTEQSTGRFVAMGDGQFLSLSRQFQKKLQALNAYAETDGKNGLKIGSLAGLALDDLMSDAGKLKADKRWKDQTKRLKVIRESQPEVPTNLQAELRDYQLEGFQWMSRLAEWGVGACLADDMGLGKTVQTLALLLARADQGPALVVAPTSVCNNWFSECQRFAPSLRPVFYRGKERADLLDNVQSNDLLICSYGLLQHDAELFKAKQWRTIVLDEAQAIKNSQAKRTKAAYQLQGDFRLITTGTPVENHLGELWSLFRFLNPGLLFSSDKFSQRFQTPIERDNDYNARQHLKRLVQPFMLRRTKNQVLQELPPRTEITLNVTLGEGERALYEAMRQQALEALEKDSDAQKEAGHLEVLAQITRLRLASCHPKLVMPDSELPSGKLQALQSLVAELLENQHKALIFSQFVKHLALIKAWLDEQGIRYHYLDGSTPQEQRQKSVEAFQRGDRDIFLISLKAGGFGLNLTAADYVIHMDPWWNPAVEDQASDRAHRIGQQRPVTIYRLVAENTIEEKIVRLHQQKRDLADSLLEGSDVSGKLSAQEMMNMIRDEV